MGVESEEERYEEVVRVPEGLERLLTNLCVRGSVYKQHAKEHDMACDTACLCVMYLNCCDWSNLIPLDVEEAAISLVSSHYCQWITHFT